MAQNNSTSNRGFAAMDSEKQREIASKGGKARSAQRNTSNKSESGGGTNRQTQQDR